MLSHAYCHCKISPVDISHIKVAYTQVYHTISPLVAIGQVLEQVSNSGRNSNIVLE